MLTPDWLRQDYASALRMVAERAVYARSTGPLVKRADVDWQSLLASPELQGAALGAGVGGLGGALVGDSKLQGGLLGALTGAGLGAGAGHLLGRPGSGGNAAEHRRQAEALERARDARSALGVLGADEAKVNRAGGDAGKIQDAVPGVGEQLGNLPAATGTAAAQGRPGDLLKQLDVFGVKNVTPFSGHFSPGTVLAAAGANLGVRGGREAWRLAQEGPSREQVIGAAKHVSALRTLLPRWLPGAGRVHGWLESGLDRLTDRAVHHGYVHTDSDASRLLEERVLDALPTAAALPGGPARIREALLAEQALDAPVRSEAAAVKSLAPVESEAAAVKSRLSKTDYARIREALPRLSGRRAPVKGEAAAAKPPQGLLAQTAHYSRKATGGLAPTLAALAPLLYREWLGSGYRSGRQPAMDLAQALQVLGNKS